MKKLILLIILSFMLVGCMEMEKKTSELDLIISKNNYIVIDVRTKEEYDTGHVKGSINIPYDEITEDTELDKDKTILLYCRSGSRSSKAYTVLKEAGYDVYDMGAYQSVTLEKK